MGMAFSCPPARPHCSMMLAWGLDEISGWVTPLCSLGFSPSSVFLLYVPVSSCRGRYPRIHAGIADTKTGRSDQLSCRSPQRRAQRCEVCRAALNIFLLPNTAWLGEVVYTHYSVYCGCVNICLIASSLYSDTRRASTPLFFSNLAAAADCSSASLCPLLPQEGWSPASMGNLAAGSRAEPRCCEHQPEGAARVCVVRCCLQGLRLPTVLEAFLACVNHCLK